MSYKDLFIASELTYTDVAHVLGCTELTARNKINGKTRITKTEAYFLEALFNADGGDKAECTIRPHNN